MQPTIAIIGDALLDVTVAPHEPMQPGGDVPAVVRLGCGGQGANLAVRAARRGATVRLACGIGEDAAGRWVREGLEADGVSLFAVTVPATGTVAILLDPRGERTMLSHRAPFLEGVDLAALVADAAWLIVSGYALLEGAALKVATRCATLPTRRAIAGCAVPSGRAAEWMAAVAAARPELVILNREEAASLRGGERVAPAEALAANLAAQLAAVVVVTEPGSASAAVQGMHATYATAASVKSVVDTTGAGDAFAAALITGLNGAWPPGLDVLGAALESALSLAREVVAVPGAQLLVDSERIGTS